MLQLMLEYLKVLFLVLHFSYLFIIDLPNDVISIIAMCADDTTLYCKSDQASDLWQQPEFTSELKSDL